MYSTIVNMMRKTTDVLNSITKETLDNEIDRLCNLFSQGYVEQVLNQSTELLKTFPDSVALNIIKGEMSLVGPRPQVVYYTDQYKGELKLILSVKPGLTDLSTLYFMDMDKILGSKNADEKYASEIEPIKNSLRLRYVKEKNFLLDIRILIETVFGLIGIKNITRLNIKP